MRRPRVRFTIRRLMVVVALVALALAYVTSYAFLRRRGLREAAESGAPGFLYVPFAEAAAHEDLTKHYIFMFLYVPLNELDRRFFGGPAPVICIMWRLSAAHDPPEPEPAAPLDRPSEAR
ncbi:MAG TPA: hypothetical protein VG406_03910 [Isosphaeraceae bacterium]|jgi:hypothetical protein|nr:hypothetical protein [Isosphaeraceae bacterium]